MELIERLAILKRLKSKVKPQKVVVILGARRVGKTKLIKEFIKNTKESYLLFNGEDQRTIDAFEERSVANFKRIFRDIKLIIIDEAQKIPDIGNKLKLMVDELDGIKIIATGSSVFDLNNKLGEPLVGRAHTIYLYPIAQMEFNNHETFIQTTENLSERLIFGTYPEILHYDKLDEKAEYLEEIVNSYLLKDILAFDGIKKSSKIMDLLKLIAFQIGKEVSIDELALQLKGISRNTVENYLNLLSNVFIIYPIKGFSRNLRKEVTKTQRWYFYDNGIRNAIIRNYHPLNLRTDVGELWENYLMSERIKFISYNQKLINQYFWRTYDQQEIDLIEEENDKLNAYEFKWSTTRKIKPPGAWTKNYPEAGFQVVNPKNYLDFIC